MVKKSPKLDGLNVWIDEAANLKMTDVIPSLVRPAKGVILQVSTPKYIPQPDDFYKAHMESLAYLIKQQQWFVQYCQATKIGTLLYA